MKIKLLLLPIIFLYLNGYSQIEFENKVVIDNRNATNTPKSVFAADIDGDGDIDILSASSADNKIAWYENLDGQGSFSIQKIISSEAIRASSVFAVDVDGDGDIDVISSSYNDNKIAWYENLDGQGTFGPQQIITTNALNARHVFAADIDGDGYVDVIVASGNTNEGKITWYKNLDGLGNFGPENIINPNIIGSYSVYAADIDNDGDIDVISVALMSNELVWYENLDSQGQFGPKKRLDYGDFIAVKAADIDNDGDMDVISASFNSGDGIIAWYENLDGQGNFGSKNIISSDYRTPNDVFVADLDGDGDLDVIAAFYKRQDFSIEWYENLDGAGNFGPSHSVNTSSEWTFSIFVEDINNDGMLDIISGSEDRIGFHKNLGNGEFGVHQYFTFNVDYPQKTYAADIDGDGKIDILSASYGDGEIAWYRNLDGRGTFGIQKTISQNNYGAKAVEAMDIDGDGDLDVVFASASRVVWQENLDGNGTFGEKRIIADDISSDYWDLAAEDLDGDGDIDVVVVGFNSFKVSWFENVDGQGNFGSEKIIDNIPVPVNVQIADLNNDGKSDIISASLWEGKASWYENLGDDNFGPPQVITSSYNNNMDFVYAADLDGDSDLDVIVTKRLDNTIVWFENIDGLGNFGPEKVITSMVDYPTAVYAADIDNDGDLDILSTSYNDNKIAWYENLDGMGNFGPQQIILADARGANSVIASDIDSDGDIDVIATLNLANEIRWFKNSLILGVNETSTLIFSIYPNPSSEILNIVFEKPIQEIDVYNNLGQLVTKNVEVLGEGNSEINVSKLSAGVYFIKIKTGNGEIGVKRFIKV